MSDKPPIQPTLQSFSRPDLRGLLAALSLEVRKQINCVRPGVVQSFNPANQTAVVKIAQQQVTSVSPTGVQTLAQYPLLVDVPVFVLGGGGFSATFPIAANDECIILFSDREIDNWVLAGGTETVPTTQRIHDLSDGMCLVGLRSYPRSLAEYSATSAQLRSDDGATYVEIAPAGIVNIIAPASINITAPQVNITASTQVTVTTPVEQITGILAVQNVDGELNPCTVNGNMVTNGDVIASGISLVHHVHSGVQSGGSNTGQPV